MRVFKAVGDTWADFSGCGRLHDSIEVGGVRGGAERPGGPRADPGELRGQEVSSLFLFLFFLFFPSERHAFGGARVFFGVGGVGRG